MGYPVSFSERQEKHNRWPMVIFWSLNWMAITSVFLVSVELLMLEPSLLQASATWMVQWCMKSQRDHRMGMFLMLGWDDSDP
jgi:hypothetical protein